MNLDLDKVKGVVDALSKGQVIDKILSIMDHGYGEVQFKVTIQSGKIQVIASTDTRTVKIVDG